MKPNVDFIMRDHRETWEGKDITKLIHRMPRDNVIEEFSDPTSDEYLMISCPESFVEILWKDVESGEEWSWGSKAYPYGTWLMDYSDDEDGYYWDGKKLVVIRGGDSFSMKRWEELVEAKHE